MLIYPDGGNGLTVWGNAAIPITTNFNFADYPNGAVLLVDTSVVGPVSGQLPTPVRGLIYTVKDIKGNFSVAAFSAVRAAAEKIDGVASSFVVTEDKGERTFVCDGTDWQVITNPQVNERIVRSYSTEAELIHTDFWNGILNTPFASDSAGAGAMAVGPITGIVGHPGVIRLATGTDANGRGAIRVSDSMRLDDGELRVRFLVQVETLSTVGEEFSAFAGLMNTILTLNPAGAYLSYRRATSLNWLAITDGGAATVVDTGVVVTAGAWYWIEVRCNANKTAFTFYINDVLVATNVTNLPTSVVQFGMGACILKSAGAGATSNNFNVDVAMQRKFLTTQR